MLKRSEAAFNRDRAAMSKRRRSSSTPQRVGSWPAGSLRVARFSSIRLASEHPQGRRSLARKVQGLHATVGSPTRVPHVQEPARAGAAVPPRDVDHLVRFRQIPDWPRREHHRGPAAG